MQMTRRNFCQTTATLALATGVLGFSSLSPFPGIAFAQTVSTDELMKADVLPEMTMGNDKASVTVVEYASMTCPHCAHFQETTFPELKKRYIDDQKVAVEAGLNGNQGVIGSPEATSQTRAVRSSLVVMRRSPSGLKSV